MNAFYPSPEKNLSDSSPSQGHVGEMCLTPSFNITPPLYRHTSNNMAIIDSGEYQKEGLQLSPLFPSPFQFSPSSPQENYNTHPIFPSKQKYQRIHSRSRQSNSTKGSFGTANRKRGTGAWTEEEDARLHDLVMKLGPKNWVRVEEGMEGRDKKQCRERWCNHVNPFINDAPFSDEESIFIIDFYIRFGRQWARMSRCAELKNRPDNAIKNHFNTNLRDHYSELCRTYGIPRRLQDDLSPIDETTYERIRGKVTAPQHPNVRSSKASRFIVAADDQGSTSPTNDRPSSSGYALPSTPWYETKSEPSRPSTQEGFPFSWQSTSASKDVDQGRLWSVRPSTAHPPYQTSVILPQSERRVSNASINRPITRDSSHLFQDMSGRFHLPPLCLPASPRTDNQPLIPTPRDKMQSDIDDEHKEKLWHSLQMLHKPNRHHSISDISSGWRNGPYPSVLRRASGQRRNSAPSWSPTIGSGYRFHRLAKYNHQPISLLTESNLLSLRRETMPHKPFNRRASLFAGSKRNRQ